MTTAACRLQEKRSEKAASLHTSRLDAAEAVEYQGQTGASLNLEKSSSHMDMSIYV